MTVFGSAKQFWNTMRSVSVREIDAEASRSFSMAVVGSEENKARLFARLFPGEASPIDSARAHLALPAPAEPGEALRPAYDIVLDAGGTDGEQTHEAGVTLRVAEIGDIDRTLARLVEQRPDLAMSMARRFPGLRPVVGDHIIKQISMANAQFAMLNALPGLVPIIAPVLPAASLGDIFVLTKNQAMMMYRLAAIHGLPLDVKARSGDLAPLLGGAFGWRAIAREVVGMVPGGVGLAAKGAIAYAGTAALGKAMMSLYQTGQQPTRLQFRKFYKEAYQAAREVLPKLTGRRAPGDRPALPPAPEEENPGGVDPASPAR